MRFHRSRCRLFSSEGNVTDERPSRHIDNDDHPFYGMGIHSKEGKIAISLLHIKGNNVINVYDLYENARIRIGSTKTADGINIFDKEGNVTGTVP